MIHQGDNQSVLQGRKQKPCFLFEVLLLIGIILIPLHYKWHIFQVHLTTTELYFGAVFILWLVLCFSRFREKYTLDFVNRPYNKWLDIPLVIFWLICAISIVKAESHLLWAKELVQITLCVCIYIMVRYEAFRLVSLQTYFKVFVTVGAVVAAVGVITYFTGKSGQMRFPIIQGRERPYLTFSDPNNFATYLAGIIPLGFAMVAYNKNRPWIWFFALTALIGCLICTVSRAAWLGTAGGVIITGLIMRKRAILPLLMVTTVTLVEAYIFSQDVRNQGTMTELGTVAGVVQIEGESVVNQAIQDLRNQGKLAEPERVPSVKQIKDDSAVRRAQHPANQSQSTERQPDQYDSLVVLKRGTDSYRVTLIKIALTIVQENPVLGVGLGNSGKVMVRYFDKIGGVSFPFYVDYEQKNIEMTPHITLLHIASEVGLPGTIVFVILVFGFYYVMMRGLLVAKNQNENFILMAGLVGAWTSMLITTSFGWIFVRGSAEFFFILTGLAVASVKLLHSKQLDLVGLIE